MAVRLNSEAVYGALEAMGWKYEVAWNNNEIEEDRFDYNVFNRAGWYDRNVDYSIFRTVIWADGNDKPMTRWERISMNDFLNTENMGMKKNMVIASQEIVELNEGLDPDFDLVAENLRAEAFYPYTPLINDSYAGHEITGVTAARGLQFEIVSTEVANDAAPYPALMSIITEGEGEAKAAFLYDDVKDPNSGEINPNRPDNARIMGVVATSLNRNVVTLGADWRHFGDPEGMLRSAFDFMQAHGGIIVPIELLDFTADHVANRVDLAWSTASEKNSSRFEVEKAQATETGRSLFTTIDEVAAAGNSGVTTHYGPVSDYDINNNNTYIYRLKMYDLDGEFEYSGEKVVTIDGNGGITLNAVVPNPVSNVSTLSYNLSNAGNVEVKLYDMRGSVVAELVNEYQTVGSHEATINATNLSSGTYRVVLSVDGKVLATNVNVVK